MATKTATPATPPSFYDNLPPGGDAAGGGPAAAGGKQVSESDTEIEQGLTGIIKVLIKMGKVKKEWKGTFDKWKDEMKAKLVEIGGSPAAADGGGEPPAAAAGPGAGAGSPPASPSPATPPSQSDESHAA